MALYKIEKMENFVKAKTTTQDNYVIDQVSKQLKNGTYSNDIIIKRKDKKKMKIEEVNKLSKSLFKQAKSQTQKKGKQMLPPVVLGSNIESQHIYIDSRDDGTIEEQDIEDYYSQKGVQPAKFTIYDSVRFIYRAVSQ